MNAFFFGKSKMIGMIKHKIDKLRDIAVLFFLTVFLMNCGGEKKEGSETSLPLGNWRASIEINGGNELPFYLISRQSPKGDIEFVIKNGSEDIVLDKFNVKNDSLVLPMHIFDTKIVAKISNKELHGYWIKNYADDYKLPFQAKLTDASRFEIPEEPIEFNFSGRWQVQFFRDARSYPAIGEFEQNGDILTGSFLTNSGDYRFLEGSLTQKGFQVSTFDGEHAYLFNAKLEEGDTLSGEYWSGKTGYLTWKAFKNENATLADPYDLASVTDEGNVADLSFVNEYGDTISLSDEAYQNKAVIIQILGSWCANCMDETAFLSDWYRENNHRNVEIIGVAFERKADFDYGASRIKIMKDRYDVGYEIVFGGKQGSESVEKALPMLENFSSYPTTIFINKDREVVKVHTGFSGPGTGKHYQEFIREFNQTVDDLVG